MRKRKPEYDLKGQKIPEKPFDWMIVFCIACPLLAITIATFIFSSILSFSGFALWAAIPTALICSVIFLAIIIASSGNDMTDVIVASIIVTVLSLFLLPVLSHAKAKAHRQKEQKTISLRSP